MVSFLWKGAWFRQRLAQIELRAVSGVRSREAPFVVRLFFGMTKNGQAVARLRSNGYALWPMHSSQICFLGMLGTGVNYTKGVEYACTWAHMIL